MWEYIKVYSSVDNGDDDNDDNDDDDDDDDDDDWNDNDDSIGWWKQGNDEDISSTYKITTNEKLGDSWPSTIIMK